MAGMQFRRLDNSVSFHDVCVCERRLSAMAAGPWSWFWAQLTTRTLLWQIYSFLGFTRHKAISWERWGRTEDFAKVTVQCVSEKDKANYKTISVLLTLSIPAGFLVYLDSFNAYVFTLELLWLLWHTFI